MRGRRVAGAAVAIGALLCSACTPKGAENTQKEDTRKVLTPTYTPLFPPTSAPNGESAVATSSSSSELPTTTSSPDAAPVTASVTDPVGDLTPSPLDPPPPWADLVGADLTRDASGFTLAIHLGGGRAPSDTDSTHTMNIGSFYDINGDGQVDEEVWANLSSNGWSGAWFDDQRRAALVHDSRITITVAGDAVVLRFPLDRVAKATTFRWSVASEWGSYASVGTVAAARDDCPDNDQPVSFPG